MPQPKPAEVERALLVAEDDLMIDARFMVDEMLRHSGADMAALASRLGTTEARLTKELRPDADPSLRRLAQIAHALGSRIELCLA